MTYNEALVIFRDLCDDCELDYNRNEYVRGGINLIADMFPIWERPVDERMDDVQADLQRIPMFANPVLLSQYGVKRYVHKPITTNDVAHILGAMGYGEMSAKVLEDHPAGESWTIPDED